MKFLVLAALIATALAFPVEEQERSKRSVFGAPGVVVSGGTSIIKGPSGVIAADTGAIAAPAAAYAGPAFVGGPYLGYGHGFGSGALIVGPSPVHPGYIKTGGHLFY